MKIENQTKGRGKIPGPYVFPGRTGAYYINIQKPFAVACRKAELHDFRFHDLRHTFASHLVINGIELYTVGKILGHNDYKSTQRYAHLSPGAKKRAVEVMSDIVEPDKKCVHIVSTNAFAKNRQKAGNINAFKTKDKYTRAHNLMDRVQDSGS